jgi:hypothetical protein
VLSVRTDKSVYFNFRNFNCFIISPYFEVKIIKIGRNTEGYKNAKRLIIKEIVKRFGVKKELNTEM